MKLYINDKYIHLLGSDETYSGTIPDQEFNSLEDVLPNSLKGIVLLKQSTHKDLNSLLGWIEFKKLPHLETVICQTIDYQESKEYIKNQFRIVKAAGGLVTNADKFLMIHRLGKWDLPKGKLDKNEKSRDAAVREVFEECGVEVELSDKLCTTWHTYIQEGRRILKKTSWFNMVCIDDSKMEPQYIEDIDEVKWLTWNETQEALKNSYRSIKGVIEEYSLQVERSKNIS